MGLEDDPRLVGREVKEDATGIIYLIIAITPFFEDGQRKSEVKLKAKRSEASTILDRPPEDLKGLRSDLEKSKFKII